MGLKAAEVAGLALRRRAAGGDFGRRPFFVRACEPSDGRIAPVVAVSAAQDAEAGFPFMRMTRGGFLQPARELQHPVQIPVIVFFMLASQAALRLAMSLSCSLRFRSMSAVLCRPVTSPSSFPSEILAFVPARAFALSGAFPFSEVGIGSEVVGTVADAVSAGFPGSATTEAVTRLKLTARAVKRGRLMMVRTCLSMAFLD